MVHDGVVGQSDGERDFVEWYAPRMLPPTVRHIYEAGAVFIMCGIFTVSSSAGSRSSPSHVLVPYFAGVTLLSLIAGILLMWRDRRAVTGIRCELSGDRPEITLRKRARRGISSCLSTDVDCVKVTHAADEELLWMRLRIRGKAYRTCAGPIESAEPLLTIFKQAGATVTIRELPPPNYD
jgi:hypothetical protein